MKNIKTSIITLTLLLALIFSMASSVRGEELLPSSQTLVKISRETLPAVVSINVTKKAEKLVLKQWEKQSPEKKETEPSPEEIPFEYFRKFFGEELPFILEEKEMEIPAAGSGLIISPEGYILTNHHVIAEAREDSITVKLNDGRKFSGKDIKVIGYDSLTDLAVLKINATDLKTVPWGDSEQLEIGEWVLAIGNPFELSGSVTQGIISAKHRMIYKAVLEDLLQTTAVINPGSSGGPLINLKGEVVGINTAIATRSGVWQGVGFAIPSRIARKVAAELIQYGQVRQGWMGIVMHDVDEDLAKYYGLSTQTGVLVMDVVANSPAEIAGVKRYDLVLSFNGQELSSPLEMLQKTASRDIGEKVELKILRLQNDKKQELTLEIKLGARPQEKELLKLNESKQITKSYDDLGLRVTALPEEGTSGIEIIDVKQGSAADKAGLLEGDIIVEINTRKLTSIDDYRQIIKKPDGDKLLIRYSRSGKEELAILKLK